MKRHIACMVLGGALTVCAPALAAEYTRLDIAASPAGGAWYVGLGAYRIGAGDGSDAGSEWVSGRALADQLNLLDRLGVQGAGLYRYASLFDASDYAGLAAAEVDAVRQVWQIDQRSKD